ncbi:MAG: outer membrane protein assembly factor BamD [Chitinophagaceae bacterium]
MNVRKSLLITVCGFGLLLASCGGFEKVRRSKDVNYRLAMAYKYFDKKEYLHANELFKDLMPVMKGTKNFEAMLYKFAYSYYNLRDWNNASYYFKFFTEVFPNSVHTEEASFLHAYSIYRMSPKVTVMQTNTEKALEVMQKFINDHPDSKSVDLAKGYIVEMQDKLEEKAALAAKLYYDISQYRAATVVYRNVQNDFPASKRMDEYQFMIVKAHYKFARESIKDKQEERYVNVINAYQEMVDNWPNSKYIKDAEKYFTLASINLKKIKK